METSFEASIGAVGSAVGSVTDSVNMGVDSAGEISQGFESGAEEVAVFESVIDVEKLSAGEALVSENNVTDKSRQIMDIPGTPHEKLEALAQAGDKPAEEEISASKSKGNIESRSFNQEIQTEPEYSPEQQIIMLQAETIKVLSKSVGGEKKVDKDELEDLIKKLKKLLEESQASGNANKKNSENGVITNTALSLMSLMFAMSEKAMNEVERETSKN